ncbi:MAG: twin-arginine translocation signal domain-containing protein [Deltaproteobacteria bacterium]|nr:twin-arginine translocation signal domain-containing protein [Deltaproteobacteria bacterium]
MLSHLDRRDFLKLGGLAAAGVAALTLPRFSWAGVKAARLDDCMSMSAQDMAERSRLVVDSMRYIDDVVASIGNAEVRGIVAGIVKNPAPTIMESLMDEKNRWAVYEELKAAGWTELEFNKFLPPVRDAAKSPQPFLSAPGSGYGSHHCYPGGLVTHTALNLQASLAIHAGYKDVYGFDLDRDTVIASQVLHDLHKPWVFQWEASGSSRTEQKLAGTGEHHPLSVAESVRRGLPAEICVAQACAHKHPGFAKDEAEVVPWLKTAAILTGVDPVRKGLLDSTGTLPQPRRMEGFVCHLGDHDFVLTVPAAQWLIPVMKDIAATEYGIQGEGESATRRFNALRNYVFSQTTVMNLYALYSTKGRDALAATVRSMVTA